MNQTPNTHVTSLELSRRLKELGVPQKSYFWYTLPEGKYVEVFMKLNPAYEDEDLAPTKVQLTDNPDWYGVYGEPVAKVSAYLASELGELLPEEITVEDKTYRLRIKKTHGTKEWLVKYITPAGKRRSYTTLHMAIEGFQRKSLPEALGLMLADVLENHLISVEELGK